MPTEDELVRVPADANPDADVFLRCTRMGEGESENRDVDARDFGGHARLSLNAANLLGERRPGWTSEPGIPSAMSDVSGFSARVDLGPIRACGPPFLCPL